MTDNPIFPRGTVSRLVYDAAGGQNSPLRDFTRATLGHPARPTVDVYLSADEREYAWQVWLHEPTGDYPLPDSDDTSRDDSPTGVFTGYMPPESITPGRRLWGAQVRVKWQNGRYEVIGIDGPGSEFYLEGVPEQNHVTIRREQLDWGLLRPTEPPSARVVLAGGQYRKGATWYQQPDIVSDDLIATYAGTLVDGQALAVQIELDVSDGTITYTAGSAFTDTSRDNDTGAVDHSAVFASYPVGASNDVQHFGWVKLYAGIQAITEQDILIAPDDSGGAGSGESNTASNVGTAGVGVFKQKTGVDLEFKKINAGSNKISVTDDTGDDEVDIDVVQANLDINSLGGSALSIANGGTGQSTRGPAFAALAPQTPSKGDLIVYNGSNHVNLNAGSNGQVLKANSATSSGLEWDDESGGGGGGGSLGGVVIQAGLESSGGAATLTGDDSETVSFDDELYDSAGYADLGTNDTRITIPVDEGGLYLVGFDFHVGLVDFNVSPDWLWWQAVVTVRDNSSSYVASFGDTHKADISLAGTGLVFFLGRSTTISLSDGDYITLRIEQLTPDSEDECEIAVIRMYAFKVA